MATISQSEWKRYCDLLRKINDKAVEEFKSRAISNLGYTHIERQKMIDYAYAIATKYGEASAALSAQMYDTVAELSNAAVPAAVPAETATYPEVAKTVNGIIKNTNGNANTIAAGIGRLVKMAGTDTILKNAARDSGDDIGYKGYHRNKSGKNKRHKHSGAQVAWIPLGDTCPFCLMLAAKGWQKQTVWAAGDHSEHIHGNCDCTYAVKFDDNFSYEGYDPDEYANMFYYAEGDTWNEKVNYLRRMQRENPEVREKINAQKRANYAEKKFTNYLNSNIIKSSDRIAGMNLQLFAESDIKKQKSTSLKRGIRNLKSQIEKHQDIIAEPEKYIPNWENKNEREKQGLIKHWNKEIRNFNNSIQDRIAELKERGDYDE